MLKYWFTILMLASYPAWATFTTVQTQTGSHSASTTCAVTVTAFGAGHIAVYCITAGSINGTTISSVSGGGTWTVATGSLGIDTQSGTQAECAYNLNTSSATTVTGTISNAESGDCIVYEVSGTLGSFAFDTANGGGSGTGTCTTCAGVSLTFGNSNNHFIVEAQAPDHTDTAIDQAYTFTGGASGGGYGIKLNQTTFGTTPNFTQNSLGRTASGALTISEGAVASTSMPMFPTMINR